VCAVTGAAKSHEGEFSLKRGETTHLYLRASPGSICELVPGGEEEGITPLTAVADGYGRVHFEIVVDNDADTAPSLTLVCQEDDGEKHRQQVILRPTDDNTASRVVGDPPPDEPPPGSRRVKGLTRDEALELNADQIAARNLPPRPLPDTAPRAFESWMKRVTQTMTWVPPPDRRSTTLNRARARREPRRRPPRPTERDQGSGVVSSSNWSGYWLQYVSGNYPSTFIVGEWTVPAFLPSVQLPPIITKTLVWVGFDGVGTDLPLVQAGTGHWVQSLLGGFHVVSHFAWTEVYPTEPNVVPIDPGHLPVQFGDDIRVVLWYSQDTQGRVVANFEHLNYTSKKYWSTQYTLSGFNANVYAEWIVERPGDPPAGLANYGSLKMTNALLGLGNYEADFLGNTSAPNGSGRISDEITMVAGANTLSVARPDGPDSMLFTWLGQG
jgi:peptidase A4-like protein